MVKIHDVIWRSSSHALAIVVTALVLSAVPVVVTLVLGILGMLLGVVLTVLFTLGGDPPILGFAVGVIFTLAAALITCMLLVAIPAAAFALSSGLIMPTVLLIRHTFGRRENRSRIAVIAAYPVSGAAVGLSLGIVTHLSAVWAGWQVGESLWFLAGVSVFWVAVSIQASAIYGTVLFTADKVRAGISSIVRAMKDEKTATIHDSRITA